jgi:predicted RNA-binding protein with PIN domain
MHILIDGYNLIRQSDTIRRFERQSLEAGRNALISFLAGYRQKKDHRITVVFDGWESGPVQEERDYSSGINILYSRRGEKADEVIKRIIAHTDEEILVVSSDREISSYAARRGKTAVSSPEFETIIKKSSWALPEDENEVEKDDEPPAERPGKKKGPARKLSRTQRQTLAKIRKL